MAVKAAGYVKELNVERNKDVMSASTQRQRIEAHVAEQGWELVSVVEDRGPGRSAGESPSLQRLLRDVTDLDKVVIVRLDRLGRRARRILGVLRRIEQEGVEVVSLEERVDSAGETGRAVKRTLATLAQYEFVEGLRHLNGWNAERISSNEFSPATLIDVGVANGTRVLYEAFPDSYLVLIEPLVEFERELSRLVAQRPGEYLLTALGAREGSVTMDVDDNLVTSSVLSKLTARPRRERREVPLTTLDRLVAERGWQTPFGIKLDAEGFEYEIIEGATATLEQTQVVIAEVSVVERFASGHSCSELMALMSSRGFEVCDVIDAAQSPMGIHSDVIFQRSQPLLGA